jgi:hypothetical protein
MSTFWSTEGLRPHRSWMPAPWAGQCALVATLILLAACVSHPRPLDDSSWRESQARLEGAVGELSRNFDRFTDRASANSDKLQQRLEEQEKQAETSANALKLIEQAVASLAADLQRADRSTDGLRREIRDVAVAEAQSAARIDDVRNDLMQLRTLLERQPAGYAPSESALLRDLMIRVEALEKKQDTDWNKWLGNLISGLGLLVGVLLGVFITPWINRKSDRRKYTLQIWEQFVKMFPDIEAAQRILASPRELKADTFARVQAVRTWMSSIATFSSDVKALDVVLLRKLDLATPMKHFVRSIKKAADACDEWLAQNPAAADREPVIWARDNLLAEYRRGSDIEAFS